MIFCIDNFLDPLDLPDLRVLAWFLELEEVGLQPFSPAPTVGQLVRGGPQPGGELGALGGVLLLCLVLVPVNPPVTNKIVKKSF